MNDATENEVQPTNKRPADVTSLIYQGEIYDEWRLFNRAKNRFYILNLERVMEIIDVQHTKMEDYFRSAENDIRASDWNRQYKSDWECSHTQLKPAMRRVPKTFSRATIIIVSLEIVARKRKPELNVYDYLRIIPAYYFVDGFDEKRLADLGAHFLTLDAAAKEMWLGAGADQYKTFTEACLAVIKQTFGGRVLQQLAAGYTATKFVADGICEFVNAGPFPKALHVGPPRRVGEDSQIDQVKFPRKAAAEDLRVPRRREPQALINDCGYLA